MIQAKLNNQAAYAVWRQDVAWRGGDRKSKSKIEDFDLPDADPGKRVIHRWQRPNKSTADYKKIRRRVGTDTL